MGFGREDVSQRPAALGFVISFADQRQHMMATQHAAYLRPRRVGQGGLLPSQQKSFLARHHSLIGRLFLQLLPLHLKAVTFVQNDQGIRRQIVEERTSLLVEIGQVELQIREWNVCLQGLRVGFERNTKLRWRVCLEQLPHDIQCALTVLGQRLSHGRKPETLGTPDGPLCLGLKGPDRVDLIAEELQTIGLGRLGWVDVEQAPTPAELPWCLHDAGGLVPYPHSVARQFGEGLVSANCDPANSTHELPVGQGTAHEGAGGRHDDGLRSSRCGIRLAHIKLGQHVKPVRDHLGGPGHALVMQPRWLGERHQAFGRGHPGSQGDGKLATLLDRRRNDHDRGRKVADERRDDGRPRTRQ